MMSLPRHNHGQGYNLLASTAIQDLRADIVPCLATCLLHGEEM